MDTTQHNLHTLFAQLGLDNDEGSIAAFIQSNSPLDKELAIYDAPFWNESQASFLQESMEEDSDWAIVVDHLATLLRDTS